MWGGHDDVMILIKTSVKRFHSRKSFGTSATAEGMNCWVKSSTVKGHLIKNKNLEKQTLITGLPTTIHGSFQQHCLGRRGSTCFSYKRHSAQDSTMKRALETFTSVFLCHSLNILPLLPSTTSLLKSLLGHKFSPAKDQLSLHHKAFHQLNISTFSLPS